jgi:predicted permease
MGPHGIGEPTGERIDVNSISEGVLSGVGQTFLVAAIGLVGRLLGVIGDRTIHELTRVTIVLLLPCFLFEAVLRDFHWAQLSDYGLMVAAALGMLAAGLALGWGGARALRLGPRDRCTAMALSGFNNSLNIPIPLALALLPGPESGQLIVLFTLYNLVWSPFIWSLGVWLIAPHSGGGRALWRTLVTPPGVAVVAGILATTPGLRGAIAHPRLELIHSSVQWVGDVSIPLALVILGGIIGGLLKRLRIHWRVVALVSVVKLLAVPALALLFINLAPGLAPTLKLALMIQAASPPATNLVIIAEHFGGDTDTVGASLVVTYALSMGTFVMWLAFLT